MVRPRTGACHPRSVGRPACRRRCSGGRGGAVAGRIRRGPGGSGSTDQLEAECADRRASAGPGTSGGPPSAPATDGWVRYSRSRTSRQWLQATSGSSSAKARTSAYSSATRRRQSASSSSVARCHAHRAEYRPVPARPSTMDADRGRGARHVHHGATARPGRDRSGGSGRRSRRRIEHGGQAEIGVFGGSGFYSLLDDVREVKVDTPYGPPSDSFFLADVAGRSVAFLPRHGRRHTIPPHRVNYRANVWAMRSLGVKAVISPCAAGSLQLGREAGRLRRRRPVRRPDDRSRRHVLRRPDRQPRLVGRDLRPDPALDRDRRHPRARHPGPRAWARSSSSRVRASRRRASRRWFTGRRLGGHQHDPVPGGVPVPRAGDGGREHQPDHRLRRRASSRGPRRSTRPTSSRSSSRTRPGSRRWSSR